MDVYEFEAALDKIGMQCTFRFCRFGFSLYLVFFFHSDFTLTSISFLSGIPISRDEAKRIVKRFSVNGTSIKFREFLRAFYTSSSGASGKTEALEVCVLFFYVFLACFSRP